MSKHWIGLLFILICSQAAGQERSHLTDHQLSFDFGSFRNRYLYAMTDIKYSSPLLNQVNLKVSARLRSYGTLIFFSKSAYDFSPVLEYYFSRSIKPIYFSAGLGLDARLRLVHDERSEVRSSAEPLLSLAMHGQFKKFQFSLPQWTRFYSNGISFTLLPELSYPVSKRIFLFLRGEWSFLKVYKVADHEWRQDCFLGAQFLF